MSNHNARRRMKSANIQPALASDTACVWPKCRNSKRDGTHLCNAHLTVAHSIQERINKGDPQRLSWLRYAEVSTAQTVATSTPEPEKPTPKMGTVYFLRSGGNIKIGWTSDLDKRMRAYPPDSLLLAVKPGTRKDENAIHRKFSWLTTHGREWFPLAPQILEEVERVTKEFGPPPIVDFSARRVAKIVGPRLNKYVGGPGRGHLPRTTVSG